MPGGLSPRHHLLPNVCTPRTAGGCVQHRATMVETLNQTMCNWDLPNVCSHVLLCTTEYVHTPPGQWGQRLQPGDCIFLETRAERTDLADCGRFPHISNFSGADRRKQNICRRDFAEEERHLPHFKYLICCFSRCSHFQHWYLYFIKWIFQTYFDS